MGMDKRWKYPQNDDAPIMWAEADRYVYKGRTVARAKGGGLFHQPEVIYTESEDGLSEGTELVPVDVDLMVSKNLELLDNLVEETAKKIYSTYVKYRDRIDLFYGFLPAVVGTANGKLIVLWCDGRLWCPVLLRLFPR